MNDGPECSNFWRVCAGPFQPKSLSKDTITEIAIYKRLGMDRLKITDVNGTFAAVSLTLAVKGHSIVEELKARDYPVVNHRRRRPEPEAR